MDSSYPPALKRFGQNFLIDHNIARKIIGLAAFNPMRRSWRLDRAGNSDAGTLRRSPYGHRD